MRDVFLIDSHAFLYKNYFALPKFTSSRGEEVGALYGFVRLLFKIKEKTDYIAACYDSPKTFRKELLPTYKSNRKKTDEALIKQIELSKEVLKSLGVEVIEKEGYEADDLIAAIAKKISNEGDNVVIVGADKDLMQIVSDKIKIWDGKSDEYLGPDYVKEKYGIEPEKLLNYFALVGDNSDNVEGAEGVGPKTALKLINKYGDVYSIISSNESDKDVEKVKKSAEKVKNALNLIRLRDDIEIELNLENFKVEKFSKDGILNLSKRFEFRDIGDLSEEDLKDKKEIIEVSCDKFIELKKDWVSISEKDFSFENCYCLFEEKCAKELCLSDIHKYFYNLKSLMNKLKISDISNYDDIYIAYHLVYGGFRKPDIERIIREKFFVIPKIESSYFKDISEDLKKKIGDYKMTELYENELKLLKVLYRMERDGIKVNSGDFYKLLEEFDKETFKIKKEFALKTGSDINLNSPKQISDFLFKKLNIKIEEKYSNIYKTKTGGYSTSEEVLKMIMPYNPELIGLILSYREYSKLKSLVEGLLKFVKNSKIHTTFDQTSTQTGRLSSYDPNLQNIPVKGDNAKKIRRCFIPEEGFAFVSFDYSQIDLRVLAHLSEDKVLTEAFNNNEDIHTKTAISIFKLNKSNVSDEIRKIAKAINFGIIYGQTPMGLSIETGISYEDAKRYIDNYFEEYSGVKKWIENTLIFAKTNGYVVNFMNRKRVIPDISSPNRALRAQSERMAVNMPVQSGSSDIIKKAMCEIYDMIKNKEDIKMILQIHDELLFEIKENKIEEYKDKIKEIMENCVKLKVPLKVDVKIGKNWAEI